MLPRMKKLIPFLFLSAAISVAAEPSTNPAPAPQGLLKQLNDSFSSVFATAAPSVVVIESRSAKGKSLSGLPNGLEFFFRAPNGMPYRVVPDSGEIQESPPSIGSGFIFREEGYILTNNHVIAEATDILVKLQDGRRFKAEVVGADERSDLAVLKINATALPLSKLGDSDAVKVGEFAFAIGTPMELPYTFTFGVVSAKGRNLSLGGNYDEFIQTDAAINPGNSGGPLCDIEGRVIGINTLISGINRGVGFAIPINVAKSIADQLLTNGRVSRPWLGISIASLEELKQQRAAIAGVASGVVVRGIEPGAPVQSSDLSPGDVITKVDGKQIALASDLQREILGKKIGQNVELEVWRKGKTLRVIVKTGEHPDKFLRAAMRSAPANPSKAPSSGTGLRVQDVTAEFLAKRNIPRRDLSGVVVTEVVPMSSASGAGLQVGDIITEAGGRPIQGEKDFEAILKSVDHDRGILLMIDRAGQKTFAILKP